MKLPKKAITTLLLATIFVLAGCEDKGSTTVKEITKTETKEEVKAVAKGVIDTHGQKDGGGQLEANATMPHPMPETNKNAPGTPHTGIVTEIIQAPPYVYAKIEENGKVFWVAVPQVDVSVGATVSFTEQMWMHNFTSKTLNRTFDAVLFASAIEVVKPSDTAPKTVTVEKNETKTQSVVQAVSTDKNESTNKPQTTDANTITVEALYTQADDLNNTTVIVKGKVAKVLEGIMGKNWIHIQDGTGTQGTNDIVFTSDTTSAVVGDEVTATGTLQTNVNFGYGYVYSVIVQDSTFTK